MSQTMNGGSRREKKNQWGKVRARGVGCLEKNLASARRPTAEDLSSWTGDQKGKLDGFNEGGIQRKLTIQI